ncbi:MAG: hypothetical protein R2695_01705 [Acidimicrobiales bacterium]
MIVVVIILTIAVAVLTVIVFGLLRTHAEILRALDRAGVPLEGRGTARSVGPVPVAAPTGRAVAGDIVGQVPGWTGEGGARRRSPHPARASRRDAAPARRSGASSPPRASTSRGATRLVIVAQDPAHDSESRLAELAPAGVRTVCSSEAWQAYDVPGSPFFALVDGRTGRVVGSGTPPAGPRSTRCCNRPWATESSTGRSTRLWRRPASPQDIRACIRPIRPRRASRWNPGGDDDRGVHAGSAARGRRRSPCRLVALRNVDADEHHPAR